MTVAYTYWHVSNGLRGCYMPDSAYVARVRTRRELKDALRYQDTSDGAPSNRDVASLAAAAWREWGPGRKSRKFLPMCAPYRDSDGYGLFVAPVTREEWLESAKARGQQEG